MTIAEFNFKFNLGCQLFLKKFNCQPNVICIDSDTYYNLRKSKNIDINYPYKYKIYEISPLLKFNKQDYLKLCAHNGEELILVGEVYETRY